MPGGYLWGAIFILLLAPVNRNRSAWRIVIALLAIHCAAYIAEQTLNSYLLFNIHQQICSGTFDLLRIFAQSVAILLLSSEMITVKTRWLAFSLRLIILAGAGSFGTFVNAWPTFGSNYMATLFLVSLLIFLTGRRIICAAANKLTPKIPQTALCWFLGLGPNLILLAVWIYYCYNRPHRQPDFEETYRKYICASIFFTTFYAAFAPFLWLSHYSELYRRRLQKCFRYIKTR